MRSFLPFLLLAVASPALAQDCPPTFGQRVVQLINQLRVENNLDPFSVRPQLVVAAQRHSVDMAAKEFLEHDGSDGSTMMSRVEDAGYHWSTVSENIAAGQPLPDSVVASWMRSPPHRANILDASMKDIGIGYAISDDEYEHYWTADFAATTSQPDVIVSGCHP